MIVEQFKERLERIVSEVQLPEAFLIKLARDDYEGTYGRYYYQIGCRRPDIITGELGVGYGGRAYLAPESSDDDLVKTIFGLYKAYVEHEARETFKWRGRRIFGPHTEIQYLWYAAPHIDMPQSPEPAISEPHSHHTWIDGGNDMKVTECSCSIGRTHADANPWDPDDVVTVLEGTNWVPLVDINLDGEAKGDRFAGPAGKGL